MKILEKNKIGENELLLYSSVIEIKKFLCIMYFRKSMYLFLEKKDKKYHFSFFSPRKVLGTFSWRSILKFIDSFESIHTCKGFYSWEKKNSGERKRKKEKNTVNDFPGRRINNSYLRYIFFLILLPCLYTV